MFGFSTPYDNYSSLLVGTFITSTQASIADASLFVSEFQIECEKSRAGRNVP